MQFVVLGDLHYADYNEVAHAEARDRLFHAFFEQVAALQPDLVFAIGDTTNSGTFTELAGLHNVASEAGLKLISVTGNHDINTLEKKELAQYFLGGQPSVSASEIYTSFDFENLVRFVILDTARVKLSDIDWSGFVSDEQLDWLHEEIAAFNETDEPQYVMILGHHPIFDTTQRSTEPMKNIINSESVYEVFATLQRTPGIYFCGHNHTHSIYGPDSLDWYFVQSGNSLDCRSFRLVTVTPAKIEMEIRDFDLSNPTLLEDFETTRRNIPTGFSHQDFAEAYGSPADHQLLIQQPVALIS